MSKANCHNVLLMYTVHINYGIIYDTSKTSQHRGKSGTSKQSILSGTVECVKRSMYTYYEQLL